ncbi:MAG: hypothetical protein ACRDSO_18865, partial [Pseudonocardiaceae bacterium]
MIRQAGNPLPKSHLVRCDVLDDVRGVGANSGLAHGTQLRDLQDPASPDTGDADLTTQRGRGACLGSRAGAHLHVGESD